jgi:hypothetical protein
MLADLWEDKSSSAWYCGYRIPRAVLARRLRHESKHVSRPTYGDEVVLAQVEGNPGGLVVFIDGQVACTPMAIPQALLTKGCCDGPGRSSRDRPIA